MSETGGGLTSGERLARNSVLNLFGTVAPLIAGLFAIPVLIHELGTERFGLLTLAWTLVGYFSLFDLGLGRALTKLVAERLGAESRDDMPALIGTAISMMAVLGVVGAVLLAAISPWLIEDGLRVPDALKSESLVAFYCLAGTLPFVIVSSGLRGILEAHQLFGIVNAIRIPLGILSFLGPLAVLPFSTSLVPIVGALVVTRLASSFAFWFVCLRVEPRMRGSRLFRAGLVKALISFGGWMTVSNMIGPIMVYMDRFLIAGVASMTAVAYYATPYDLVTKLWIIPVAILRVMFPAFATALSSDRKRAGFLFQRTLKYIFLALFPLTMVFVTLAYEGLSFWLGYDFAENGALVLQLLTIGVFVNALSRVPFSLIQSEGRPDLTAKLHLVELPFYLAVLWLLLDSWGIVGAALAWLIRNLVDTIALFVLAHRLMPDLQLLSARHLAFALVSSALLAAAFLFTGPVPRAAFLLMIIPTFLGLVWRFLLVADERALIGSYFRKLSIQN